MNELALEIKKLADKYRNNQQYSSGYEGSSSYEDKNEDLSENYFEDFSDQKLDKLEGEIANFNQPNEEVVTDNDSEIQIADFINPQVNIVEGLGYKTEGQQQSQNIEFDREEKSEINGNIRLISKNLRDLKALLREDI